MKVLLVTDWSPRPGGSEAYILWLRDGLIRAGDEVRLLTSGAGSAADGSADFVAFGSDRAALQAFLQVVNPSAFATARRAVRDFAADVAIVQLFAYHLSPAVLYALADVPTVLSVGDYKPICPVARKLLPDGSLCTERAGWVCHREGCVGLLHWVRDRPRYALLRGGVRGVDRVLACSRWMQAELARDDIPAGVLRLPVPPPGPDYRRAPAAEPRFVFSGRLSVEKGVETLLRAFDRVGARQPAAQLRVLGDGPDRPRAERIARELGLEDRVRFAGWVDPGRVERELAEAWALVAPSLWAEPLGFVALEAIVRGVPVVASATGGFAETVDPGVTGTLVPNGDVEALAGALVDVAVGRAFPDRTIPPAIVRSVTERFGVERHVVEMRAVLRDVIEGR